MIKFTSLTLRNFLSYGNNTTVFPLDRPGTTLIMGEDLDNTADGKGANGVGKSAIINALTYGVYDKPISNISKDNLVNNINKKNMEVIVEFETTDGMKYLVRRTRKAKSGSAGNTVHLFVNGEDKTPDSIDATNKEIERIIGIPYELFVRIVVFSASHTPFLDLKQADQTSIIEELFGLTMLTEKAVALKDMIKDTERRIDIQKARISALEGEQTRYKQQVATAKQRIITWDLQIETSIKELETKLKKIQSVDVDQQRTLHETVRDLNEELTEPLNRKREVEKQIREVSRHIQTNEQDLAHLRSDKCPRCKQIYANAPDEISAMEAQSEKWADELVMLQELLTDLSTQTETLAHEIKTIRSLITVDNVEELIRIKNESSNIKTRIEDFKQAVNPYYEPLQELEAMEITKPDYDDINKATILLEHQQFLLKLLTKKDSFVRKALLNKNIPYLNIRLQHYLTLLGLPHKVEFTHEMTAKISQFSRELDFGNLSAGQRARVNFALSLAFKDVLQSLHTKINVCILDEVLDIGLDTIGVQAAARLLKRKARDEGLSLYIISHRDEIDRAFDKVITVQLTKGFSYIVETE